MHLSYRNVNEAFREIIQGITIDQIPTTRSFSRAGSVIQVTEPVVATYTCPRERVLFNRARDCNPFFHLFEALWMLAGRNDVASLAYYNPRVKEYSDNGNTFRGAYGRRWVDGGQLPTIISRLKKDPYCGRQVLSMWRLWDLHVQDSKDLPCNTHAYFSIVDERLNITVCSRSNNLIWGMLGANYVHFSFLQEYLATCIGVDVGAYHQFTNNLYAYLNSWCPNRWLAEYRSGTPEYRIKEVIPLVPLVRDPKRFNRECFAFTDSIDGNFQEPFLRDVAQPMMAAFRAHKQQRYYGYNSALAHIDRVWLDDWRIAGRDWIEKRLRLWEAKNRRNPHTV